MSSIVPQASKIKTLDKRADLFLSAFFFTRFIFVLSLQKELRKNCAIE